MTRITFFQKLIKYILLLSMALIVIALGRKVITTSDCSVCPGKSICNGKTGCNKY